MHLPTYTPGDKVPPNLFCYKLAGGGSTRHFSLLTESDTTPLKMFKYLSLVVLLALAAVVLGAEEVQDQEAAEQFFATYGYYPSWYSGFTAFRTAAYPTAYPYAYSAARYPYAYTYSTGYPYAYAPYNYKYVL